MRTDEMRPVSSVPPRLHGQSTTRQATKHWRVTIEGSRWFERLRFWCEVGGRFDVRRWDGHRFVRLVHCDRSCRVACHLWSRNRSTSGDEPGRGNQHRCQCRCGHHAIPDDVLISNRFTSRFPPDAVEGFARIGRRGAELPQRPGQRIELPRRWRSAGLIVKHGLLLG